MAANQSKISDPRYWGKWLDSGAIRRLAVSVAGVDNCTRPCHSCGGQSVGRITCQGSYAYSCGQGECIKNVIRTVKVKILTEKKWTEIVRRTRLQGRRAGQTLQLGIILILKRAWKLIDASDPENSKEVTVPAGRHKVERIPNPFGHSSPWLVLEGSLIGSTEGYFRSWKNGMIADDPKHPDFGRPVDWGEFEIIIVGG